MPTPSSIRPMAAMIRPRPGADYTHAIILRTATDLRAIHLCLADERNACSPELVSEEVFRLKCLGSPRVQIHVSPAEYISELIRVDYCEQCRAAEISDIRPGMTDSLARRREGIINPFLRSDPAAAARYESTRPKDIMRAHQFLSGDDFERLGNRLRAAAKAPDVSFDPKATYGCYYCGSLYRGNIFTYPRSMSDFEVVYPENSAPLPIRCIRGCLVRGEARLYESFGEISAASPMPSLPMECPCCLVDAVVGPGCGESINRDFLHLMWEYWFWNWSEYVATHLLAAPGDDHEARFTDQDYSV